MTTVPTEFWIVGREPRRAHVRTVTPSRIYVEADGGDLEVDREAFVADGVILGHDGTRLDGVLALTAEDAAARADAGLQQRLAALDETVDRLGERIAELKRERKERRRERKRLRAQVRGG